MRNARLLALCAIGTGQRTSSHCSLWQLQRLRVVTPYSLHVCTYLSNWKKKKKNPCRYCPIWWSLNAGLWECKPAGELWPRRLANIHHSQQQEVHQRNQQRKLIISSSSQKQHPPSKLSPLSLLQTPEQHSAKTPLITFYQQNSRARITCTDSSTTPSSST